MRWRRTRRTAKWALAAVMAATLIAWPLSRWWILGVGLPGDLSISVMSGCLFVSKSVPPPVPELTRSWDVFCLENSMGRELGLIWRFTHLKHAMGEFVTVPLWSIVPILAAGTGFAWRSEVRALVRRRRGACLSCGYDRRGLAADAKCPECGTVATPTQA